MKRTQKWKKKRKNQVPLLPRWKMVILADFFNMVTFMIFNLYINIPSRKKNVTSTMFKCWGAQAGLYHYCGIPKYPLPKKMFGIFPHLVMNPKIPLVRGFDEEFLDSHSRHTEIRRSDMEKTGELQLVSESPGAGVYILMTHEGRQIFVTGHSEYDPNTLKDEYKRDVKKGLPIDLPVNYFPENDPSRPPMMMWKSHANLLYYNWLNYNVYQATPLDINEIK